MNGAYLSNKGNLLPYVFNSFNHYFRNYDDLHEFVRKISPEARQEKFLRLCCSYNLLVKNDAAPGQADPRDETYKFISLISMMEALYREVSFVDFHDWLKAKQCFPISDRQGLQHLWDEYQTNLAHQGLS